jgi:hypothetical protein
MNLIFDLETDGLLNDVTQIHCLAIHDLNDSTTHVFNDRGNQQPIVKGIEMLEDADTIIGHNIIGYDCPVIHKLFPWFERSDSIIDTLLLSRLYHADILKVDQKRKWKMMPLQLYGRHSLEAYGHRLGVYKGSYGKTTDWSEWSQEMEDYCVQDVNVTVKLWQHFHPYLTGSR